MRAQHTKNSQCRPQLRVVLVDLNAYRAAKQQTEQREHLIEQRREVIELITERVVEQWDTPSGGFDRQFFYYALRKVSEGQAFSVDQARAILPVLLQVTDELDRQDQLI
jgi:hypothetical protein